MDDAACVEFVDVEVLESTGLLLRCRTDGRVFDIPPLRLLPGTEISRVGDRGRLVLPSDVVDDLGIDARVANVVQS